MRQEIIRTLGLINAGFFFSTFFLRTGEHWTTDKLLTQAAIWLGINLFFGGLIYGLWKYIHKEK